MQPYPPQPMYVQNTLVRTEPPFIVRFLWFIFLGWWLGLAWLVVGYTLCLTILLMPIGLMMLNRLPSVLSLGSSGSVQVVQTAYTPFGYGHQVMQVEIPQYPFIIRAVWFLFIGWWAGFVVAALGYALCVSILLLPVGLVVLEGLPAVLTLRRRGQ